MAILLPTVHVVSALIHLEIYVTHLWWAIFLSHHSLGDNQESSLIEICQLNYQLLTADSLAS